MKTRLLALLLLAGSCASARVFFGFGFGYAAPAPVVAYAPAPVVAYAPPPAPLATYGPAYVRPGYTWIGGYWYPVGARWSWHAGYWARPPYAHAYWVAPRYYGHRFYGGYWHR